MSAINFVVRDVAGNISRGSVAGEGVPSSLAVGAGADISLNLTQGQVISYTRQGQALEINLIDGRTIVIEGFFIMEGVIENELFLSADGFLTKVHLTSGAGAHYYASYVQGDGAVGKFALSDDLYFMRGADVMLADSFVPEDDEVGMLGTAFDGLAPVFGWGGAAAAGAAALVVGGGGGGSAAPEVAVTGGTESNGHVVNEEDHADGVEIAGTGTPGATVDVTIQGTTETTAITEGGTWEVVFDPTDIDTGEYSVPVEVTATNEGGSTTVNDVLVVDTIISAAMDATGGADGVVNAVEYDDGMTLTGTVSGSNAVVVTINGQNYDATVTYDEVSNTGTWTLDVPTSVMGTGEYTQTVTISTSDAAGNSYSTTASVEVDTLIGVTGSAVGGADGVVNASEFGGGVTLSGAVTGNDSVTVTIDGQTYNATVSYDEVSNTGTWTLAVPTAVMGQGEYTKGVVITTTDAAGNSDSATMNVEVDTLIGVDAAAPGGADSVINATEFGSGVMLTGAVTGNDAVSVTINGQSYNAVVSYNDVSNTGTWTLAVPMSVMGNGEYTQAVFVTTTDAAGNSASTTLNVEVDTLIGVDANATGGSDGVINGVEYGSGVMLSGSVTGNDAVTVTIDGQSYAATVSYNEVSNQGTWTLAVPTAVMGQGEYTKGVVVTTTDAAGNSDSATMNVEIDTYVNELSTTATVAGDDIVNNTEAAQGLTLSGTVEVNSTVSVTYSYPGGQIVRDAQVDGSGNWSISYASGEVPEGDYTANVTIAATDEYGNTNSITDTFKVDTQAPEAPGVAGVFVTPAGVTAATIDAPGHEVVFTEVTSSHQTNDLAETSDGIALGDDAMYFDFDSTLPNGSHLVVSETDTSGNSNTTFVVLEETGTDVVDLGGLSGFDIGSIDLGFAQDAVLTLDLATLEGLSDNDNNLVIRGSDADNDTVNILGADTAGTTTINGKSYDIYTMGDDAQIFIEDGVHVNN